VLADIIFGFILGAEWGVAGSYAGLLAPWMLLVFATSPVSIVFAVLDKQKESFEWSLYSTLTGLGTAATAAIGAALAQFVGFAATFTLVGVLSLLGCLVLLKLEDGKHKLKNSFTHYHTKRKLVDGRSKF